MTLKVVGKYLTIYVKNKIIIVILNQETAIKCVSQELLKFCFNSSGSDSLAHNNIHHRNIASSLGYILYIVSKKNFLNSIILFSTILISFFHTISKL
ncbi:MAG: hypothetical protein Q8S84_08155 [bacterium]|nr:hypothetical protein [bacterium]MDP3381408.1 hypothetical protein [bacterium]